MIGERDVAIFASIVDTTTLHPDGNNVSWAAIMFATGLRVDVNATHIWNMKSRSHSW
jgi:hypothetical protein